MAVHRNKVYIWNSLGSDPLGRASHFHGFSAENPPTRLCLMIFEPVEGQSNRESIHAASKSDAAKKRDNFILFAHGQIHPCVTDQEHGNLISRLKLRKNTTDKLMDG